MSKVLVAILHTRRAIAPALLRHDPAEPALAAAVDGTVEEGRFLPFGRTRSRERRRAISARRRGRIREIGLVAEILAVVGPRRARIVAAVLRWGFWMPVQSRLRRRRVDGVESMRNQLEAREFFALLETPELLSLRGS